MDAVSDRDFVAETLFDSALVGVHLSRMGEELVLWTTAEFNFATLGDAFTTGSSMLPQKKNSDVAELARAKSGRLVGNLTSLLVTLKGLPLSYNRDLQEDKEPLFDSVRQVTLVLAAMTGAYRSLTFNADVARTAADDQFLVAIDIAEKLVEGGVPFRQAHERVGPTGRRGGRQGRPLRRGRPQRSRVRVLRRTLRPRRLARAPTLARGLGARRCDEPGLSARRRAPSRLFEVVAAAHRGNRCHTSASQWNPVARGGRSRNLQ